jgi:hypothetical protein
VDEALIRAAVLECLARCRSSGESRTCIAEFVLTLQELRCWDRHEAEEVGRRAIRAIRKGENQPTSWDRR